jgi:hypothetical protein
MGTAQRIMIRPPPGCVFIPWKTQWSVDMYLEFPEGREDEMLKWFADWAAQLEWQVKHIKMQSALRAQAAVPSLERDARDTDIPPPLETEEEQVH